MSKIRVSVCLPADLWMRAKSTAARQSTSASELVARGLSQLLTQDEEARRAIRMRAVQSIINAGLVNVPEDPDELNRELSDAHMPHGLEEYDELAQPSVH